MLRARGWTHIGNTDSAGGKAEELGATEVKESKVIGA